MQEITGSIRDQARRLFSDGSVDVVIGYQQGWDKEVTTPAFVTDEAHVDKLVFDERCTANLARYLVGREGYLTSRYRPPEEKPRVAVVARPATMRSLVGLIQEHQLKREEVYVLGIVDGTPVGIEPDVEVGRIEPDVQEEQDIRARMAELEALPPSERWLGGGTSSPSAFVATPAARHAPFATAKSASRTRISRSGSAGPLRPATTRAGTSFVPTTWSVAVSVAARANEPARSAFP
jgi:hypothetical protein